MFGQKCNFKLPEVLLASMNDCRGNILTLLGILAAKGDQVPKAKYRHLVVEMAVNKRRVDANPQPRQNRENIPCYVFPPITPARTPLKGRRKRRVLGQNSPRKVRQRVWQRQLRERPLCQSGHRRRVRSPDWWRGRRHAQKEVLVVL